MFGILLPILFHPKHPARGRKLLSGVALCPQYEVCSFTPNTPQGDGNIKADPIGVITLGIFHPKHPARGRKPSIAFATSSKSLTLSPQTPRKGTETATPKEVASGTKEDFHPKHPARGRKPRRSSSFVGHPQRLFHPKHPARGRKHSRSEESHFERLCNLSPQTPRKGTET